MQATKSGRLFKVKTVIMLDDDELLLQAFRLLFRQCLRDSYIFRGFQRMEDALIFLQNESCHLILLDLSVPGTAWDNITKLREVTRAPIVLHSGWNDLEEQARQSGADGFIAKPCAMIDQEIKRLCG